MILITGAKGFLGSRLISSLKSSNFEILSLCHGNEFKFTSGTVELDLTSKDHIEKLKREVPAPETVIHLASSVKVSLLPDKKDNHCPPLPGNKNPGEIYDANVLGTVNILEFCLQKEVKHLIFASSQTVYGMPAVPTVTEDTPCAPLEHYAASKVCGEIILRLAAKQGLAVTALRFPGVYSEERKSGIVYKFCESALKEQKIIVKVDFPLPLDVIHIDDVVEAFKKAVIYGGKGSSCFNIATGELCSPDLLADAVAELVPGCKVEHSDVPQPAICMNSERAQESLGWKALPRNTRLLSVLESIKNAD